MERDRIGRRRRPDQERGLRPLHPPLPDEWISKALRLAMSDDDWMRFEALVRTLAPHAPSQARAYGQAVSALVRSAAPSPEPSGALDWMDWERRKTLRLLWTGR